MTEPLNFIAVDRRWFLTWTTYGTWLPGDQRGFVGVAPDESGQLINHNRVGTPPAPHNERLRRAAEHSLKGRAIVLDVNQAEALFEQFQETARIRHRLTVAVGIMRTHLHLVTGVTGDPPPDEILRDLKAYGSRRLNAQWGRPQSDTWWTAGGSKRKVNESDVETVVQYIRHQPNPLLIWTRDEGRLL